MRYRSSRSSVLISVTYPSARHQPTLQDHGYGLVYNSMCLFTPQLSLGTQSSYPRRDGSLRLGCLVLRWGGLPVLYGHTSRH